MRILGRDTLHRGKKFDLALHRLETASGAIVEREFLVHRGAVVLIPVLADDQVVLVRNYRHAVGEELLELPAGTLEPDEDVAEAAIRELAEETGYRAGRCRQVLEFYPSPGIASERMVLFLADQLEAGTPQCEVDEELTVTRLPLDEALAMTRDGRIRDAKTLIGLWHADFLRTRGLLHVQGNG